MKEQFNSMATQRVYINAFLIRYTDVEKVCQFCGEPASITHNKENPYQIKLVCPKCKKTHKDELASLKPINLLEHVKDVSVINELNETDNKMIEDILVNNYTANQITKKYHIGLYTLKRKLLLLKDKDEQKYNLIEETLRTNASNAIRQASLNKTVDKQYPNNINKIKLEKNIVNKDIAKAISTKPANIAAIATGAMKISVKKKCLIAEALKESLADVFPEETYFNKVYKYSDFLNHVDLFRSNVLHILERRRMKLSALYKNTDIPSTSIRSAIYDEEKSCTTEVIKYIASCLDMDPFELVNEKKFN